MVSGERGAGSDVRALSQRHVSRAARPAAQSHHLGLHPALEGCELNTLYERQDDGSEPGKASLRERAQVRVEPGRTIALMPDDIHAVANLDAPVIRHIHFYGRAVEVLDQRLVFDLAAGTCKPMLMEAPSTRSTP